MKGSQAVITIKLYQWGRKKVSGLKDRKTSRGKKTVTDSHTGSDHNS